VLDGEGGFDFARFTGSVGAKVSLATTKAQSTGYGVDTFRNIEGLSGGSGADRFTGNGQDNSFYGNAGHDTLSGGSGADTLWGGAGKDRLTGGSGKDVFVFNTKPSTVSNVDRITDFLRKDDTIQLENAIFKKLAKVGTLSKSSFVAATKAKDKNDYIVYDKSKGALYYDADGSGQGAAVKIAQLNAKTVVGYNDFVVI
jgi:serralysin